MDKSGEKDNKSELHTDKSNHDSNIESIKRSDTEEF